MLSALYWGRNLVTLHKHVSTDFGRVLLSTAIAASVSVAFSAPAKAHCEVGNRILVATLTFDDPCVADEAALPTIAAFQNGDHPSAGELDVSGEFDKTITEYFGVELRERWIQLNTPGDGSHEGFDDLGTAFKYQFVSDAKNELAMSAALDIRWGGTGSSAVGAAPFTILTPTWYVGKGFGFLPEPLLRPLGLSAAVGYAIPTQSSTQFNGGAASAVTPNAQFLIWDGSLQYSLPYLQSHVENLGWPNFVNHLVPLVEWKMETQTSNFDGGGERTTGTINPGLAYLAEKYQLTAEAIIPVNRASGEGVGAIGELHLFFEEIFPRSLGKPLFGGEAEAMQH